MAWAKTGSVSRFNLATSGIAGARLGDLEVSLHDLEINPPGPGYGYGPLRQALADRYGVPFESVVTAAGTSFANHLAMAALLSPGDEVVMETPVYDPLPAVVRYLGCEVRFFERRFEDRYLVDPERVSAQISSRTRLIVVSRLHNPTGAPIDEAALLALGELARKVGAKVLVDEVYQELGWVEGERPDVVRSAALLGEEFVVTSSLTKAYGLSGLRCGWILAAPELAERMGRLDELFSATGVHAAERLSVLALAQLPRFGDRAQAMLARERQALDAFLASRNDLEVVRPPFGTVVFPRWQGGETTRLCQLLREKYETTVVPGAYFAAPEHFRLGIAGGCPDVPEALGRLGAALDELE